MKDQHYQELLAYKKKGIIPDYEDEEEFIEWARQFEERNNHIYVEKRRLIPESEKTWIMSMFHDNQHSAHQSAGTMIQHIRERYVWETMSRDIKEYVKTCWECQQRGGK